MRNKKAFFLISFFILSLFTPLFDFKSAKAIQFTARNFWFFVDEPTTIDHPEMYFTIMNDMDVAVQVNVSYMPIEGVDFQVFFEWKSIILDIGESKSNHYAIQINSTLAVTINVQMLIKQKPLVTGEQVISSGGIVVNRITFYTEEEGSLLDLQVVDQSGWPRNASIDIQYKINDTMTWTPIKSLTGLGYNGYLPNGKYFVRAQDIENPNIYSEKTFDLTEDSTVKLILELVGFKEFRVLFTEVQFGDRNITICGLNATINNFVGILEEVKIYAEMYENDTLIESTLPNEYSEFFKTTNFGVSLWFPPVDWQNNTNYVVRGIIQSHDLIIATKTKDFWYFTDEPPPKKPNFPLTELLLILGTLGTVGVIILIWKLRGYVKGKEIEQLVERHAKQSK